MVAVKTAELPSFLKSAAGRIDAFLIHGLDTGQVSETAGHAAKQLAASGAPPGEIIRLSDQDLAGSRPRRAAWRCLADDP
jgi:hypothetical protein